MEVRGFVGPTYEMDAVSFDSQRCVNMYPIVSEVGTSKTVTALRSVPGYELFATLGGGPIRGAKATSKGRSFVVSGDTLYEVFTDGTSTSRGTLNTATVRVSIAENGVDLMIVDGLNGYLFNFDTNILTEISDPDFPVCDTVTYLDGYFIVPQKDTSNFYISGLLDGTTWETLDFSNAAASPDNLVCAIADQGNL